MPEDGEFTESDIDKYVTGVRVYEDHFEWLLNLDDSEESKQKYRDSQKLRSMERAIRKTKRELIAKQKEIDMVAETDVKEILQKDYDKLAYKLSRQNKAFNEFSEEKDLRKQYDRINKWIQ